MPKKTINPKYDIGDIVYLVTDDEGCRWQVYGYEIIAGGWLYKCTHNGETNNFYSFELTDDKPIT